MERKKKIYAIISRIGIRDFSPKTIIVYKNDADIFVYSIVNLSIEMIQGIQARSTNIVIDDDFLLSQINEKSMIYLLTIDRVKDFLETPMGMDKQSISFFNSFLRKDKIKKIIEYYG